jgi:hypothetical protein
MEQWKWLETHWGIQYDTILCVAIQERRKKTVERCESALGPASVRQLSWLGLTSMVGRRIWRGTLTSECERLTAHRLQLIVLWSVEKGSVWRRKGGRSVSSCLLFDDATARAL